MGRQDYHWKHEPCLYGWKDGKAHLWNSDRKQTTLMEFDQPTKALKHPTMKPVKMIAYQVQNNTQKIKSYSTTSVDQVAPLLHASKPGVLAIRWNSIVAMWM